MFVDFLFPQTYGSQQPLDSLGSAQTGLMAFADGVNWNPIGDGAAHWVVWTGTAWVMVITLSSSMWIDYSTTSTIIGWSSFTTKYLNYTIIGKVMYVHFDLQGTSNSTTSSFTLPINSVAFLDVASMRAGDNGVFLSTPGLIEMGSGSSTVTLYTAPSGATWTASGTKSCFGEFFYRIA